MHINIFDYKNIHEAVASKNTLVKQKSKRKTIKRGATKQSAALLHLLLPLSLSSIHELKYLRFCIFPKIFMVSPNLSDPSPSSREAPPVT